MNEKIREELKRISVQGLLNILDGLQVAVNSVVDAESIEIERIIGSIMEGIQEEIYYREDAGLC